MRRFLSAALFLVVAASAASMLLAGEVETLADLPYAESPHAEQHLDFHWPQGGAPATVLFIHGGSLREGGAASAQATALIPPMSS